MATKREEMQDFTGCLHSAGEDEQIFVLRAKDPLFVEVVKYWANRAIGLHELSKIERALAVAEQGEQYYRAKNYTDVFSFTRR